MSPYVNAHPVRERVVAQPDDSEIRLTLLQGEGADAGRRCIHRVHTDAAGRLRSDIVYFYDAAVTPGDIDADFDLLARGGLMSVSQLHHTESMLNRGARMPRRG